jgi:DNA uptake protein ComE-like DNA-binding protein
MYWMSKSRYRGTVLLAMAVFLTGFLNFLYSRYHMQEFPENDPAADIRILDSLLVQLRMDTSLADQNHSPGREAVETSESLIRISAFNPNKISKVEWLSMGLPLPAFESLERYRQKGGIFRRPDQVYKIPHLSRLLAAQLEALVRLDTGRKGGRNFKVSSSAKKSRGPQGPFDLNLADSLQLKSVFGIGSRTASRILEYRRNLGGFVKEEQLYEIWGLDSLVAEELMDMAYLGSANGIRFINPNNATEEELALHPYIRKGLARLIVRYRKQHPPYARPEDLLGIRLFRTEQLEKLKPYLRFE